MFIVVLVPRVAVAQSANEIDEARKNARIRLGGLYLSPSLMLKELGVDTNVFNEGGEPRRDFIATVTPKLRAAVPIVRRALISGTAAADVMYFARYASQRSINPQFAVRAELFLNRLVPFAEVIQVNTRDRLNLEIDARVRHIQDTYTAGVVVKLTAKTSVQLMRRYGRTRFADGSVYLSEPLDTAFDGGSETTALSLGRALTPLTTVSVGLERTHDRFSNSPIRNTDSYGIVPGVDFKARALIQGSARVGYRRFAPLDQRLPAQKGLVSQLALSYRWRDSAIVGVTFDRDYHFSYSSATPYFTDTGVGVSIRKALVGSFDLIVDAKRSRYDYERLLTSAADAAAPPRRERTDTIGFNLGYRLKRDIRIGFDVTRAQRHAVDAGRGYRGFRYAATMSTSLTK